LRNQIFSQELRFSLPDKTLFSVLVHGLFGSSAAVLVFQFSATVLFSVSKAPFSICAFYKVAGATTLLVFQFFFVFFKN